MTRLDRPAETLPKVALAIMDQRARLFERLNQARERRGRLDELALEAGQFARDVRALAERVAPDLVASASADRDTPASLEGIDPGSAADAMHRRLGSAREARQRKETLHDQIGEREDTARVAAESADENRLKLEALCREARCESVEELPDVEKRAERRQELEKDLATLNDRLQKLSLSAGLSFDEFLRQASGIDLDSATRDLRHLKESIDDLEHQRALAHEAIGGEQNELKRMDGNARAAEAGQEAEDLRARIKADVEEYARLRLAAAVLRAGIERYRKKAEDPLLERASRLFATLTLGSFAELRVDYNDRDEPVLKGVRRDGQEALGVEAMSLGTADQLYFALRLAALAADLERREPLPLIVDDVLIQFDDARAGATLEALAHLSKRTQVLIFTHHEHLLELAQSRIAASLLPHTLSSHHRAAAARG
jgi:uncharacterized protein YhaN